MRVSLSSIENNFAQFEDHDEFNTSYIQGNCTR